MDVERALDCLVLWLILLAAVLLSGLGVAIVLGVIGVT